jgi:hypothetical protein
MDPNKRDLRAFVRYDGRGRIIPGSLVLRRTIPKNGNWREVAGYLCCGPNPSPFYDVEPAVAPTVEETDVAPNVAPSDGDALRTTDTTTTRRR